MTDRVDKCDREFEEKKNQYRKYWQMLDKYIKVLTNIYVSEFQNYFANAPNFINI